MNYTQAELDAAFKLVANSDNWKMPIDSIVSAENLTVVLLAIAWFAGSGTQVTPLLTGPFGSYPAKQTYFRVTAPGYYVSVGA